MMIATLRALFRRRPAMGAGAVLLTLILVLVAAGAPIRAAGPSSQPPAASAIDRLFARWTTTELPGCTAGVASQGRRVLSRAYGMANLEHGIANRPDTIIEAGSVSKQFTAAAVLLLVQEGKLSLDDPIRKFIPEVPDYGQPITIRHLLTHTSGLRDWGFIQDIAGWPRTTRAYTHDDVLDIVSRQRALNFAPGTEFSYTNSGYNLAAILVSRVSGRSFADYTREALFEPLGMTRTSWRDDFSRIVPDRAIAYSVADGGVRMLMPFENVHGNGGLLTTTGDLLKWAANLKQARVGGAPFVVAQLTKGRLADGSEILYTLGGVYATSWRDVPEISHSGGTAGYRAWLAHYPNQDLSVAVLCNASDAPAWVIGRQIADLFLPVRTAAAASPVEAPDSIREVAGLYRNRRTHEATGIEWTDGGLQAAGLGPLTWLGSDLFGVGSGSTRVQVVRTATGSVGGMQLLVSGERADFERVDPAQPSAQELQALAGRYTSQEADVTLDVSVADGSLVIRRRGNRNVPLRPTYKDAFTGSIGTVRFLRAADGRPTGLSIGRDRVWDLRFSREPGAATIPGSH